MAYWLSACYITPTHLPCRRCASSLSRGELDGRVRRLDAKCGQQNAVGQSKNQAFVFCGDFSTAAGQFSHFVYGWS